MWLLATSRSTNKLATGLERMDVPRSACSVSAPGITSWRATGISNELLGQIGALTRRNQPANDVAAKDVQNDVEMKASPLDRAFEFGDVPRPDLVGRCGQ